jgi:hypothetical protein
MLENDVDALLLGQLTDDAFETVFTIVDDVIGAERLGLLDLVGRADRGDDGAAHLLGELDRRRTDAGAAGMDQDRLARLESGVVEQHVLDRAEGDGATAAPTASTPGGAGTSRRAGRLIFSWAKPSRWKPCTPPTCSQRLSRPSRQALHSPQVRAP